MLFGDCMGLLSLFTVVFAIGMAAFLAWFFLRRSRPQ